ncbi:MAG: hypothetical protein PHE29_08235 [Tissierellia bacterium]|nr:hypothetical protein [Tissierellia bacterium]MDD4779053.1 hypothetical protein [Tissierellia bacterium]
MSTKLQKLNGLGYQLYKLILLYEDILMDNIGLAMQFKDIKESINSLIEDETNKK